MYFKHGAYWQVQTNRWTRLGDTLHDALQVYARLTVAPGAGSMPEFIGRVLAHVRPRRRPSTVSRYTLAATPNMANRLISFLRVVFDPAVEC